MKIGLFPLFTSPMATPEFIDEFGRAAEERGFDSIWAADPHVVNFDEYSSVNPYTADGKMVGPKPGEGEHDCFLVLSYLASVTNRIRLGTGVCILPQRNPVYTAKEVTTLDHLSRGRVDFGVGIGWLAEEFEAVGVPWERRGDRCRAYLELMLSLWHEAVSSHESEFFSLPDCRQGPKPIQRPHPPIHFGGNSDPALTRVADLGQGWYGFALDPLQTAQRLSRLDELLADRQRTRAEIQVSIGPGRGRTNLDIEAYAQAGVDQLILPYQIESIDELASKMDSLVKAVLEPAHAM